jgi:anti-sigma factor RsiW
LRVATALRQEQARRRRAGRVGLLAVGGGLVAAAALILLLTRGGGVERLAAPLAAQAAIGLAGPDAMATSDLAALQRWFEGRLDYGVPVPAITGATLAGGRVVELDGQRAAAVVYWFHEQPVTYFPMPSGEVMGKSVPWEGIASASAGGYEVAVWREGSLARAVAAPMPRDDVMRIAAECRAKALMAS